jgi:hypothetical protein
VIEKGWNWFATSPARIEKTCRRTETSKGRNCSLRASERKLTKTNCPGAKSRASARGSITISVTNSSRRFTAVTR